MQASALPVFVEAHPTVYGVACPFGVDGVVYVYILKTDPPVLIDTGVKSSLRELDPALERVGVRWRDIAYVINTHGHIDHMGGNESVLRRIAPTAQVLIHPADLPYMQSLDAHINRIPDPSLDGGKREAWLEARRRNLREDIDVPTRVDRLLQDGDVLDLGDARIRVMHVPGHSHGSCALLIENEGILIAADAAQARGSRPRRFPFVFADPADYLNTQRRLAALKPATLCLGHAYLWHGARSPVQHASEAHAFLMESCDIAGQLDAWARAEAERVRDAREPNDWPAFQDFARGMLTRARDTLDTDYVPGEPIPDWATASLWQYWRMIRA